ncbi:hypothetical protein E2320_000548, partial [Naja naja]
SRLGKCNCRRPPNALLTADKALVTLADLPQVFLQVLGAERNNIRNIILCLERKRRDNEGGSPALNWQELLNYMITGCELGNTGMSTQDSHRSIRNTELKLIGEDIQQRDQERLWEKSQNQSKESNNTQTLETRKVTVLNAILHPALLITPTGKLMTVNNTDIHTTTLFPTSVCRVELCSLFVVPALVDTATLSKRDTLIPTEDESRVTDTAFNAWSITRVGIGKIATGSCISSDGPTKNTWMSLVCASVDHTIFKELELRGSRIGCRIHMKLLQQKNKDMVVKLSETINSVGQAITGDIGDVDEKGIVSYVPNLDPREKKSHLDSSISRDIKRLRQLE